jgi:hypothetical protein
MSVVKEFLPLMLDTVTIQHQNAVDKYGKPSWGSSTSYRCRIMNTQRMIRDAEGREIVEAGRAVIYGVVASASPKDRMTLPSGATPPVVSVSTIQDEDGAHHTVVGFGQ